MSSQLRNIHRLKWRSSSSPLISSFTERCTNKKDRHHELEKNTESHSLKSFRYYHATQKKEVLPLIAVGVGVIGIYSFRALKRMDKEWEDYEEELREYNLEHGINNDEDVDNAFDASAASSSNSRATRNVDRAKLFRDGTLALDLGTLNVRIAHKPTSGDAKPNVVVNREGKRATPNHILFEADGNYLTGSLASSKLYERANSSSPVVNPGVLLRGSDDDIEPSILNHMVQKVISSCAKDALEQAIGRKTLSMQNLFAIDRADGYNVRPVFIYPPKCNQSNDNNETLRKYREAVQSLSLPDSISSFVSEPVCSVAGAKFHQLLPSQTPGPVLVIDVGASVTSMSIVDNDELKYSSELVGFGGEALVESLMDYICKDFYNSKASDVSDTMAVQRIYDASKDAILELSSGSKKNLGRVQINIPYLSVDEKMQPKHLDVGVSAVVLNQEFNHLIPSKIVGKSNSQQNFLSSSMPSPTTLTQLMSSMIMQVMESSNSNPFSLNSVLVVGGGSRSPAIQNAIKEAVSSLAGDQYAQEKVIIPRDELIEELTVVGASLK